MKDGQEQKSPHLSPDFLAFHNQLADRNSHPKETSGPLKCLFDGRVINPTNGAKEVGALKWPLLQVFLREIVGGDGATTVRYLASG